MRICTTKYLIKIAVTKNHQIIQNTFDKYDVQWNPVNTVTNGPKKIAVLMG